MCNLCEHETAIPGRTLCPTCLEALLRLAGAVRRIEAKSTPALAERKVAASDHLDEFRAAYGLR